MGIEFLKKKLILKTNKGGFIYGLFYVTGWTFFIQIVYTSLIDIDFFNFSAAFKQIKKCKWHVQIT